MITFPRILLTETINPFQIPSAMLPLHKKMQAMNFSEESVQAAALIVAASITVGLCMHYVRPASHGQKLLQNFKDGNSGLEVLHLLDGERTWHFVNPAVSAVSFYEGSCPLKLLTERVSNIIQANPYLAGRLVHGSVLTKRESDATIQSRVAGPMCIYPLKPTKEDCSKFIKVVTDHSITPDTPCEQLFRCTLPYAVKPGDKCLDLDEPLLKVTIFHNEKDNRFCMMVSMSHVIVDGYTYYKLLAMLNPSTPVLALDFARQHQFETEVFTGLGFGSSVASNVLGLCGALMNWFVRPPMVPIVRYVNNDFITAAKRAYRQSQSSQSEISISQVDFNMSKSNAQSKECGNALNPSQASSPGTAGSNFLSTNDILMSWFFRTTRCKMGAMIADYRMRKSYLKPDMAGNYAGRVEFNTPDMYHPVAIREAVSNLTARAKEGAKEAKGTNDPSLAQVFELNLSAVTNWAAFFSEVDLPGCRTVSHLPLFDMPSMPIRNGAVVFQANQEKVGLLLWVRKDVIGRLDDEGLLQVL